MNRNLDILTDPANAPDDGLGDDGWPTVSAS